VICFSFEVDKSSKLPIISRWDNLADNPGGGLAWFTFFFFGVVSFGKDCAVVTGKSPDADANVDANADADKNNGGNNNANANADDDDSNDNDDKYTDVANATQSRVSKKGSTTTKPGINNAATMMGTPIAATLTSGSVAVHDSSGSVAVHDSCNTNKGNKNVSIMSDLFFRTWN
jgi:hypothetical protein